MRSDLISLKIRLLKGNLSANFLELLLDVLSLSLGSSFLDNLGSSLNCVLSFLKSKSGDLTNNLDNLNLLSASLSKFNVELGLLFCRSCNGSCYYCYACCCGYAELFLYSLYKIIELKYAELLYCIKNFLCR